jgi:hypothetical protein
VTGHKVTHACRGPSDDRLDIVRETIIPVGGMEAGHSQQVLEDMVRQIAAAQFLVSPLLQWHLDIGDGATEGVRIFAAKACTPCDRGPVNS